MKRRFLIIAIVLIACAVAIGVYKDAEAQLMTYSVFVYSEGGEVVDDARLEIRYKEGPGQGFGDWFLMETDELGNYWNERVGYAYQWQVVLGNWNLTPVDPDERFPIPPSTYIHFDWLVE